MTYTLADVAAAELAEIESDLIGIPATGPGKSRDDIAGIWQRPARRRIDQLVNLGRMRGEYVKSGRTRKWVYWSIPAAGWSPRQEEVDDDDG